ncbi:MAG: IS1595 family transposase [Synechococcus sp. SB0676_bin_10]|uniref:IS1595 family transposase n=1 Tax=Synechococcus sp. SB0676_bin_10 TaxID=2604869 RepID=A0A6B1F4L6_9SYNE|nr:IS1595 family transposase [Synechococcus sp. SB0676_bin_10]MYK06226.1 IS1595 family transposase [Synechococcus sp. SB0670_bin_20]MYK85802.1 IS1595 family transposase [Synechococcus sp. SB0669_bin_7]
MCKAAGQGSHGKELKLVEVAEMFAREEARAWIQKLRWPQGPCCPHCGSGNVQGNIQHQSQTHRCRECTNKPMFTMGVGTVMQGTHLKYREWAMGIYLYTINIKGISSMQLHRVLGISQKAAWFLLHRLRMATEKGAALFAGPVEADETYIGGKRKNMSNEQRKELRGRGRGTVGQPAVVG